MTSERPSESRLASHLISVRVRAARSRRIHSLACQGFAAGLVAINCFSVTPPPDQDRRTQGVLARTSTAGYTTDASTSTTSFLSITSTKFSPSGERYHRQRPHKALGSRTPEEFANSFSTTTEPSADLRWKWVSVISNA